VHPKLSVFVGAGQAALKDIPPTEEEPNRPPEANYNVLVVKPMLEADVNVANWFIPALYVGYRFVFASDYEELKTDFTGIEGGLALKFVF
jgi:hypothetical protein